MAGSSRFFDHTTFSELQWKRDSRSSEIFALPPGFETQSDLLDDEFIEVLRDVYALQCIRETSFFGAEGVMTMAHIDNHQASVQSRLVALSSGSRITECCHIAAYLCSTMLRCKLWRTSTAPVSETTLPCYFHSHSSWLILAQSHLSARLLHKLWQSNNDPTWDGARDLLAWLLYVGGAFAPTGRIRSNYIALLHMNRETRLRELDTSWLQLLATLKQFIWSEKAFAAQVKAFWSESLC